MLCGVTASQKIAVLEDLLVHVRRNGRKPGGALAKANASGGALGHAPALDEGPPSDSAATTLRRNREAEAEQRRRSTIEGPPPRAVETGRLGTPMRPLAPANALATASANAGVIVLTAREELETPPVTAAWEPSLPQQATTTAATAPQAVEKADAPRVEPARKQRLVALAPPMGSGAAATKPGAATPSPIAEAPASLEPTPLAAAGRTVGTAAKIATAPRARIDGRVESAGPDAAVRTGAIAPAFPPTKAAARESWAAKPLAKALYDRGATLLSVGDEAPSTLEAVAPAVLPDEHTVKIGASMLADARAAMAERAGSPDAKPVARETGAAAPPLPPPLPAAGARSAPPPPSIELTADVDHEALEDDGDPLLKTVVAGDLSVPISLSLRSEPPPASSDLDATVQMSAADARSRLEALASHDAHAAKTVSQPPPLPGSKAPFAPSDLEPAPTIEIGGPPEIETAAPGALTFELPPLGEAAILPLETPTTEPERAPEFLFADIPAMESPASEATGSAPVQKAETKWTASPAPTTPASTQKPRTRWVGLAALVAVLVGGALFVALRSGGGKAPDAPPSPTTAKPTPTVAPTAAATVPAPPASASSATTAASASAAPSASAAASAASSAGPAPDGANLPDDMGYLIVESSVPAEVYVNGHMVGLAGQPLQVPCGARFLRTGKPGQASFFLSGGESHPIACKATTKVTINPAPFTGGAPGPSPAAAPEGGQSPAPAPKPKPKGGDDPYN